MASYRESSIHVHSSTEEFEPPNPNPAETEQTKKPEEQHDSTASMTAGVEVQALTAQRSTSPLRSKSPLRSGSPHRTRKFFQEKVHEAVRRARYGQWDFDFSPRSAHSTGDDKTAPPLTVPPWGPVSAKDIFTGILRPGNEDPDWKYQRQKSVSR